MTVMIRTLIRRSLYFSILHCFTNYTCNNIMKCILAYVHYLLILHHLPLKCHNVVLSNPYFYKNHNIDTYIWWKRFL